MAARSRLPLVCPKHFLGQIETLEAPNFIGAPEEIRTPDPQIRSLMLTCRGALQKTFDGQGNDAQKTSAELPEAQSIYE
jgi:hypothetical protein